MTEDAVENLAKWANLTFRPRSVAVLGGSLSASAFPGAEVHVDADPETTDADLWIVPEALLECANEQALAELVSLLAAKDSTLILAGFETAPRQPTQNQTYFGSLSQVLAQTPRFAVPVGRLNEATVFVALQEPRVVHPRDIKRATLARASEIVNDTEALVSLVARGRQTIGFFPDHLPHCVELPWIVARVPSKSSRVLDVGAGVSVLPLFLAEQGHTVTTCDPSQLRRDYSLPRDDWNEWGFLDYSTIDPRISSINDAYEDISEDDHFDVIYSVGTVVHVSAATRKQWLELASRQLTVGGLLIITAHTIPFTDRLWNYASGRIVEDPDVHGGIRELVLEIESAGFRIIDTNWVAKLAQTDVGSFSVAALREPIPNAGVREHQTQ